MPGRSQQVSHCSSTNHHSRTVRPHVVINRSRRRFGRPAWCVRPPCSHACCISSCTCRASLGTALPTHGLLSSEERSVYDVGAAEARHPLPSSASGLQCLKDLNYSDLERWCEDLGESKSRARQIWRFLYADGKWIRTFREAHGIQDGFSSAFVERATAVATCSGDLHLQAVHTADDGTKKLLFSMDGDSSAQVETVLIPVTREQGSKSRITVCVSSQVGCAMNCQFCFTGKMGLQRNLRPAQIVEQLIEARRLIAEEGIDASATNIVYMGMGEPFNNMDAVMTSISIATDPLGLHFSKNKITVSTVGLVPEIRRFCASKTMAQLAVSLHAPTNAVRDAIVPVNKRYPLSELIACLEDEFPRAGPQRWHGRHVLFEYVMLAGVNDSVQLARELVALVRKVECKINLIIFNSFEGAPFTPSSPEAVQEFRSELISSGLVCTVRDSRGPDEMAACGQLGNAHVIRQSGANQAVESTF